MHANIGNCNHRDKYNTCEESAEEHLNYSTSIRPSSIGRKNREMYSTTSFSNGSEYGAINFSNGELSINPRHSRIRHYCNGPRPETKL